MIGDSQCYKVVTWDSIMNSIMTSILHSQILILGPWVWVWLFVYGLWWFLVYLNRKINSLPSIKGFLRWDDLPIAFFSLFIHPNKPWTFTCLAILLVTFLGWLSLYPNSKVGKVTWWASLPVDSVARKSMAGCRMPWRVVDHARSSERYLHLRRPCFQLSTRTAM